MSNYSILRKNDGTFECFLQYQDGHDIWVVHSMEEAYQKLVAAAWTYNGVRINRKMIEVNEQPSDILPNKDSKLLQDIHSGNKVVLNFNDFRLVANLLPEEVELIYALREGRAKLSQCACGGKCAEKLLQKRVIDAGKLDTGKLSEEEFIEELKKLPIDDPGNSFGIDDDFIETLKNTPIQEKTAGDKFRDAMKSMANPGDLNQVCGCSKLSKKDGCVRTGDELG